MEHDRKDKPDWGRCGSYGKINYITTNFKTRSTFWNGLGLEWDPDLIDKLTWRRTFENSDRSRTKIEIRPNEHRQNVDLGLNFRMELLLFYIIDSWCKNACKFELD